MSGEKYDGFKKTLNFVNLNLNSEI